MIKTVNISAFSAPDYVATALEGSYGLDGRENIYFTCVKGLVFVNAAGPLHFDEDLPTNLFPWHLVIYDGSNSRQVYVSNSHLTFDLAEGETARGSFRIRA